MHPANLALCGIWAGVILTLAMFVYVQFLTVPRRLAKSNPMNLMVVAILLLTFFCTVPEYFVYGRTEPECWILQRFASLFYLGGMGMIKFYFVKRSNQVAGFTSRQRLVGNILLVHVVLATTILTAAFEWTLKVEIIEPDSFCLMVTDPMLPAPMFLVNFLTEITINIRFLTSIMSTVSGTSGATSAEHARAPKRLLRLTCAMCILVLVMNILTTLVANLPILDPSLQTAIFSLDLSFSACATAWPAIIIRCLKTMNPTSAGTTTMPRAAGMTKTYTTKTYTRETPPGAFNTIEDVSAAM